MMFHRSSGRTASFVPPKVNATKMTYSQRGHQSNNAAGMNLLLCMDRKKSNLCFSADVTTKAELLRFAELLGPHICCLKTHIDIIEDFDRDLVDQLSAMANKHDFLIFEDRKFADIGNTVKLQYSSGIYKIAEWAHITNAHSVPGPGVIEGLKEIGLPLGRGLLMLAEMSSSGALTKGEYIDKTVEWAQRHGDFVMGFVTQHSLTKDMPHIINFTPGVNLSCSGDGLGQQYHSPEQVGADGADVFIVGRGIYHASDPLEECLRYKAECWKAYETRLSK